MRIILPAVALLLTFACSSETEAPPEAAPDAAKEKPVDKAPRKGKKGKGRKAKKKPAKPAPAPSACTVTAIVDDPDPKGLNIRAAPDGDAKILGQVPKGAMLTLVESKGAWVRFSEAMDHVNPKDFPTGWVAGGLLTTALKTPAEYGPETKPKLRKKPAQDAEFEEIPFDPMPEVTVAGCSGAFLRAKVKVAPGDVRVGWLGWDSHCGNPVTTCP